LVWEYEEEYGMFNCERCGSGYNANYVGVENCPRCLLLDRVQAPLTFKLLKMTETSPAAMAPVQSPEAAPRQPARSAP
jgi:late competence protein required for DNA uptake (superfamily II DNA/RNA helicase)